MRRLAAAVQARKIVVVHLNACWFELELQSSVGKRHDVQVIAIRKKRAAVRIGWRKVQITRDGVFAIGIRREARPLSSNAYPLLKLQLVVSF